MSNSYVCRVGTDFRPEPETPIMESLFQQYERVIVESILSSFALDFLIKDQHGGDVDTIHNVRKIGEDDQMTYKNKANEDAYRNHMENDPYDSRKYHSHKNYIAKNREISEQKKNGTLKDAYTGDKIARNEKSDLDHVISAKKIHEDRGRILAGLSGPDLANSEENLQATNPKTNRSKKADSMDDYLEKKGDEYTPEQRENMREKDAIARKSYEQKLAKAYYTSPGFIKDLSVAAGAIGAKMGLRQAMGFFFTEIWFAVKEEFQQAEHGDGFDLGSFFSALGRGIKKGAQNARVKYKELFSRFLDGAAAGALSSITTTLCNIFFTTAKNVVKIIRQSYASLVQAFKVLFLNPDRYPFGERICAVAKILSTGASVIVGSLVSEALSKTPVGGIPVVGEIIPAFCGSLVTGIMSCTLLYFLDRSEIAQKLFRFLDRIPTIDTQIEYYRRQAAYFEQYAAELMNIDLDQFRSETALYKDAAASLEKAQSEKDLNAILNQAYEKIGIKIPWGEHESFGSFMKDRNAVLVFE